MGHTRTADSLYKSLFYNAVFNVERKFARALLGSAPTHTVSKAADVGNLLCLYPLSFFGNGGGTVFGSFGNANHILNFV